MFRAPSWGITGRLSQTELMTRSPGPVYKIPCASGLFNHPTNRRPPRCSFDTAPRHQSYTKSPGPGQYSVNSKSSCPAYSMRGRCQNGELIANQGSYDLSNSLPRGKAYSMLGRGKQNSMSSEKIPGPGTYKTSVLSKTPKWSFGRVTLRFT